MKKAPTIYLHVGTHKTGSSAIQAFAATHRSTLRKRGLDYPSDSPYLRRRRAAHHWFAHSIADDSEVPITVDSVAKLASKWRRHARWRGRNVFISAEAVYRHVLGDGTYPERRRRYLERLSEVLAGFNVVVLIVFRRPDDYIRSLYQERVMRAARPLPQFSKFYSRNQAGLRYYQNAGLFRDVFPDVRCLVYEDLTVSGHFFSEFFRALDVDVSDLADVGVVRKSLTPAETLLKNFANKHLPDRKAGKAFLRWMRTPPVQERIREAYGDGPYDLWPSHAAREEFLEGRANDIRKLRKHFFPGRDRLFPPIEPDDTVPEIPPLPDELRRMVLHYLGR